MFTREIALNSFMLRILHQALDQVGDDRLDELPAGAPGGPALNSPRWILGHLAVAADYAGKCLGLPPECPESWHAAFGMGSNPAAVAITPSKAELVAAIERGYHRAALAARRVPADAMSAPVDHPIFKGTTISTVGDVLAHLLTTHLSFHMGQLSYWRRLAGLPAMF